MKKKSKFRDHIVICSDCEYKDKSSNNHDWEKNSLEQNVEELKLKQKVSSWKE